MTKKILFICLGNICRSCTAEEIMRTLVAQAGLTHLIEVDSAGLIDYHEGELPDSRMRRCAAQHGYKLTHHSRPLTTADYHKFDMIIGMDENNIKQLLRRAPDNESAQKVYRMVDFCQSETAASVPDPYYGGEQGFELVISLLEDACGGLLEHLTNA